MSDVEGPQDPTGRAAGPEPVGRVRSDPEQAATVPGIHRYQFFTDLRNRTLTQGLNRVSLFGIAAFVGADVVKALLTADPQTIYCYECRACYATQDSCPAGILRQGDLVIASRCGDYRRFLALGGLSCIRCGNCTSYCVQNLDLPRIFAAGQHRLMEAMRLGRIPRGALRAALAQGLVNRECVDEVAAVLGLNGTRG